MAKLQLTLAASDYAHTREFTSGGIQADGIEINYISLGIEETFYRFIHFGEWDVSEISSGKYTSLISQGDDRFVAIPVFPSRVFRQSSLYIRPDGPVKTAEDLRGKRIGIPEWGHSASVYTRGWLQHDVGIPLSEITWVQAGVNEPGRKEKVALDLPKGIEITSRPDKSLSQLLLDGDIDAINAAHPPEPFAQRSPDIKRLFPNYREVEETYYRETGIWPIMHFFAIRREVFEANRWIARNLYKAFEEAKNRAMAAALEITASRSPFAWCYESAEKAREVFGEDFFPYGIEPNRKTLEAFLLYTYEQGLAHRHLKVEDLFPPELHSEFKV